MLDSISPMTTAQKSLSISTADPNDLEESASTTLVRPVHAPVSFLSLLTLAR